MTLPIQPKYKTMDTCWAGTFLRTVTNKMLFTLVFTPTRLIFIKIQSTLNDSESKLNLFLFLFLCCVGLCQYCRPTMPEKPKLSCLRRWEKTIANSFDFDHSMSLHYVRYMYVVQADFILFKCTLHAERWESSFSFEYSIKPSSWLQSLFFGRKKTRSHM
jgi:hypothetical protein